MHSIFCAGCLSKLDHLSNPPVLRSSDKITSRVRNGYNLPLSAKEITQIDTFLIEGSESLSEHDNAIAEIEGLLLRLKNSRDSLQRRCDSARYLISAPIRRLPLDVLHEIFMLCCVDVAAESQSARLATCYLYMSNKLYCPTLELTWVCSFWRTFIQSCPNLWSSISVDAVAFQYRPNSFQILKKYLSHSADILLDFNFKVYAGSGPMASETMQLFMGCSPRWRRAVLRVPNSDFLHESAVSLNSQTLEPTSTQLGSFPALEVLDITSTGWWDQELFFQSFSSCPRLRVVNLVWFSWLGHNADFSCVTSLTLSQFSGKSFGHLLRRLPVLESLEVHHFELSDDEDNEDDVDDGSYTSSLTKLTVSAFPPVAWRSTCLPHLTNLTFTVSEHNPLEQLRTLSSVLYDSQCRLNNLRIYDYHYHQSPQAVFDLIASQDSLTHLAIFTHQIDPFVEFLKSKEDGSYVIRDLRYLEFSSYVIWNTFEALACSICDLIESRCTVLYSANGNPEISGLQVLTVNFDWDNVFGNSPPSLPLFVHNRLPLLKEAGFKLAGSSLE